jgi:hypothetical protein
VKAAYDYDFDKTHYAAASVHGVIPCCKFFAILASANGRYIFGEQNENSFMANYAGGTMPGRYYDQQIQFIGYNTVRACERLLTTVDMEFRFKVGKKVYLSLIGAAMHDGLSLKEMAPPVYAAGLQFGYKAKRGPIMVNLHWNSAFNKVGFYFSVGYDF